MSQVDIENFGDAISAAHRLARHAMAVRQAVDAALKVELEMDAEARAHPDENRYFARFRPQYEGEGEVPNNVSIREATAEANTFIDEAIARPLPGLLTEYLFTDVKSAQDVDEAGA